ncbi:endonuclease/exonuclease/phosphatase family protein [Allobaculum sp. Allo2]|uniref:endonuclease/exonuclease/phosphatase family protein n=1 Tax=Allobaculum sp. Allo2 TaxID=2853432 RepID=UPI0021124C54|nr:endonuclease/exonuclease/phosphatase family protein [Allobaculum sp. Allo2]
MELLTWNVNGIRALARKGLEQMLDYLNADIVCFQEIKATEDQIELNPDLYPYQYVNSAVKKGYSGTMIASRMEAKKSSGESGSKNSIRKAA